MPWNRTGALSSRPASASSVHGWPGARAAETWTTTSPGSRTSGNSRATASAAAVTVTTPLIAGSRAGWSGPGAGTILSTLTSLPVTATSPARADRIGTTRP